MAEPVAQDRPLTAHERRLVRRMLELGGPEAAPFVQQSELAKVTPWRCPCGCASINFAIEGYPMPTGGLNLLAEFDFGDGEELSGIFIYEKCGILAGVEVYSKAGEAPTSLPEPEALRPIVDPNPQDQARQ